MTTSGIRLALISLLAVGGCGGGGGGAPVPTVETAAIVVREVHDRSPEAAVEVATRGDTLLVTAVSPSGIGGVRLERTAGYWPTRVDVRLRYSKDRAFSRLEGAGASLEDAGATAGRPSEHLTIRRPPAEGASGFELELPERSSKKVLYLHWIDAYRR